MACGTTLYGYCIAAHGVGEADRAPLAFNLCFAGLRNKHSDKRNRIVLPQRHRALKARSKSPISVRLQKLCRMGPSTRPSRITIDSVC